jgi:hypothetical protein
MKTRVAMILKLNWLRWAFFWISSPTPDPTFASRQAMLDTRRRILKKLASRLKEERRSLCKPQMPLPLSVPNFDSAT